MVILDETEDTPRRVSVKSTQFRLTFAHHQRASRSLEAQIVRLIELTELVTIALENIAQVLLAYDAAHGGLAAANALHQPLGTLPDTAAATRPPRDPPTNSPAADLETILFPKRPDA